MTANTVAGPLDRPHRSGSADRDHQDPPAAVPRSGGTAHPLGALPHFASSQALALGNPVQPRPGPAARHSTSYLTATSEPEPPNGQPNVPANSCQPSPGAPLAASSPHHLALPNVRRLSQGLPAANEDRHRHPLPEIGLRPSPPLAPHRPFHRCNVIPSVDSGLTDPFRLLVSAGPDSIWYRSPRLMFISFHEPLLGVFLQCLL